MKIASFKSKGFTLAELMISVTILALLITFATAVYANFFGSVRNLRAANLVYEEARFVMERIVKEIRNGTIDYEEYYNQAVNFFGVGENQTYGQNYCQYSRQFYGAGQDDVFGTFDDVSAGERNENAPLPISNAIQQELYLINIDGNRRTYIKRLPPLGDRLGRVGLITLVGQDNGIDHFPSEESGCPPDEGEGDGRIDSWFCDPAFECEEETVTVTLARRTCTGTRDVVSEERFLDITPASLDITNLRFIITPQDDPRKAYNIEEVQIQPHVTVQLIARANPSLVSEFQIDRTPDIVLESTVSARVYNEIVTECNLRECLPTQARACPRTLGVCGPPEDAPEDALPAQQTCSQGVWPGCDAAIYEAYSLETYEENLYEDGSETRCLDNYDNDCDGAVDETDMDCILFFCNNGSRDPTEGGGFLEECIDVGGICNFIRPVTPEDNGELCTDGYDNDCDYAAGTPGTGADEFDAGCVEFFCRNNQLDPRDDDGVLPYDNDNRVLPYFAPADFSPPNLIPQTVRTADSALNEVCPNVGGLCTPLNPLTPSPETDCRDGLDNDCNGAADELDEACRTVLCNNEQRDCDLVSASFEPRDFLTSYEDNLCDLSPTQDPTDLDEACRDAGGICGGIIPEAGSELCTDGINNDCSPDGRFDGNQWPNSDRGCCPDNDADSFSERTPGICEPPSAVTVRPNGVIDCNDTVEDGGLSFPGNPEICNDFRYPLGHPLAGQGVDNNCSFANGLTSSARDISDISNNPRDPELGGCCIDADGDGYGIPAAHIAFDGRLVDETTRLTYCGFSAALHRDRFPDGVDDPADFDSEAFSDCDDTNLTRNPGIAETGDLCRDSIDNDCDGLTDTIDSFPDTFDPDCCDFAALEICDNGSDDNCNGRVDMADDFCVNGVGREFLDNFSSTEYRALGGTTAQWTGNGVITITETEQTALSAVLPTNQVSPCANITSVRVTPLADLPGTSDITYQFSLDGSTWCGNGNCTGDTLTSSGEIRSGIDTIDFAGLGQTGDSLRWRTIFYGNETDIPTLNSLALNFTCTTP